MLAIPTNHKHVPDFFSGTEDRKGSQIEVFQLEGTPGSGFCAWIWLWVKNRYPKWNPGKWTHGLKPAVPWCFFLTHTHMAGGQNQWYHFGVGAPPILGPILVGIGMFTGGMIRILSHGHMGLRTSCNHNGSTNSSLPVGELPSY